MTQPCLWIIPTRGRPANADRLHEAMVHRAVASDWAFIVDADDPSLDDYLGGPVPREHFLVGPERMRMGPLVNWAWDQLGRGRQAVGFMGDDHLPRTGYFDTKLLACLGPLGPDPEPGRQGVTWGDDLLMHDLFPTAGLLGGAMLDAMGYMVPPGMHHLCIDVAWSDLGAALGQRWYRPDVVVEHLHPAAGKATEDASYRANNNSDTYDHDVAELVAWRDGSRHTDLGPSVERIRAVLGGSVGEQEAK